MKYKCKRCEKETSTKNDEIIKSKMCKECYEWNKRDNRVALITTIIFIIAMIILIILHTIYIGWGI